jgi:hypothetical protein
VPPCREDAAVGLHANVREPIPLVLAAVRERVVERPREYLFNAGDIASDGAGGVVLLCWSEGRLHVGDVTIPAGASVVDLDGDGNLRWSNRFHQTSNDYLPIGLAVDGAGNTVVAQGTNKGNLLRLTRIDRQGTTTWAQRIRSRAYVDVDATAVAADPRGNTLFAGTGHAYFDSDPASVTPGGPWLAKLDPTGALLWYKSLPVWTVASDPEANILLVSRHAAMKLDPDGNPLWSRDVLAGVQGAVIAGDEPGRTIVAGTFTGTLDLGDSHLSSGAGSAVIVVAFAR